MTYQNPAKEFVHSENCPADQFAHARNSCIDAFARLETTICKCIVRFECGLDAKKVPLSQRLATLAKVRPSHRISKERAKQLAALTRSCEQILTLRGSMVHSVMAVGEANGEAVAIFHNAADVALKSPICVVLTQGRFEAIQASTLDLANQFNSYLASSAARPSSPNPASSDAARPGR